MLTIFSKLMRFSTSVRFPSWIKVISKRGSALSAPSLAPAPTWAVVTSRASQAPSPNLMRPSQFSSGLAFCTTCWVGSRQGPGVGEVPSLTFEKEGHEGDDWRGELGESHAIGPVVPGRVLWERDHNGVLPLTGPGTHFSQPQGWLRGQPVPSHTAGAQRRGRG